MYGDVIEEHTQREEKRNGSTNEKLFIVFCGYVKLCCLACNSANQNIFNQKKRIEGGRRRRQPKFYTKNTGERKNLVLKRFNQSLNDECLSTY